MQPRDHRNQQYSIVGLTNAAGTLVERYTYTAYGTLSIHAPDGTSRGSSSYNTRYTYTGREWDPDLSLYHFRARWYDPATGGFISRDPLGYVDGMSLYRGYFAVYHTDWSGTSCSVQPCLSGCAGLGPLRKFNCERQCRAAAKKFLKWFDDQMRDGKPNYSGLPSCPCSIKCDKPCWYPTKGGWLKICAPDGWTLNAPVSYPLYLERYHPGAEWDMRSDAGPPRTQCTYDKDGNLITTGPGIGTVDEGVMGGGHVPKDVRPVDWIIILEGGRLTGGCWFNMYKRMRPLLNRHRCARNS